MEPEVKGAILLRLRAALAFLAAEQPGPGWIVTDQEFGYLTREQAYQDVARAIQLIKGD